MGQFFRKQFVRLISGVFFLYPLALHAENKVVPDERDLAQISYKHEIKGLKDQGRVFKEFSSKSGLRLLKTRPVYSYFVLSKRVQDDQELLQKILFSFGYYGAKVTQDIQESSSEKRTHEITLTVNAGPRYTLKNVRINFSPLGEGPHPCQKDLKDLGLFKGKSFTAEKVLSVFDEIKDHLSTCGYPFAKTEGHKAILSHEDHTVDLELSINPGPFLRFGELVVKNPGAVPDQFVKNRSPFKEGEVYDQRKVDEYQDALSATRLFQKIQIQKEQTTKETDDLTEMPMSVSLSDAKHRTIAGGVKYGTADGLGAKVSWEHRNITGHADKFLTSIEKSTRLTQVDFLYRLPDFLRRNQTLVTNVEHEREKTDAYTKRGYGFSALLETELKKGITYFYGLMWEGSRLTQDGRDVTVDIIGVPLGLSLKNQDDDLDPTQGGKVTLTVTPEYGHLADVSLITRTQIYGAYHFPLDKRHRNVLGLWARLGMTFGGDLADLPADRRFYSGGGGSIRGYGHQLAGPVNAKGKPIGGKSLLEFGVEPRMRVGENWGLVAFLEGGIVSDQVYPKVKQKVYSGVGAGVRYYTPFGPIRLDAAIPLHKRRASDGSRVDRAFQVYISIGQAF